MLRLIRKIREGFRDFYKTDQLDSFFCWLTRQPPLRNELVYLKLPFQEEFRACSSGRSRHFLLGDEVSFIICAPGNLQESLQKLHAKDDYAKSWFPIFYSPHIEIWENKLRHTGILPLRFGLSREEKAEAVALARDSMRSTLRGEHPAGWRGTNRRFKEIATVDVVIWVGGKMRGSWVIANKPFHECIINAARGALRDERFKPMSPTELKEARIEIDVMSDLNVSLSEKNIAQDPIDGRKGYVVSFGKKEGWYFPATFNSVKFQHLKDLAQKLAERKANIPTSDIRRAVFSTHLVEGCIEGAGNTIVNLDGPVAVRERHHTGFDLRREALRQGNKSANWLLRMQDSDGYMPLYADPLTQNFGSADWVRISCTAYALIFYGRMTASASYVVAGKKTFSYALEHVFNVLSDENKKLAALAYLGKAALCLDGKEKLEDITAYTKTHWRRAKYEPILYANLATFFSMLHESAEEETTQESILLAEQVFADFEHRRQRDTPMGLALYAELVCTFFALYRATGENTYLGKSKKVAAWLVEQQLGNGAFPGGTHSSLLYTRGSGKIFEALAVDIDAHFSVLVAAFKWLAEMQYSKENTYFVPPTFKKYVIGGFRHDYVNAEAWIDGAAHFLMGAARILSDA